jgi:hypothetical protein
VHQHDGHRPQAVVESVPEFSREARLVECLYHFAVRSDSLVCLDHPRVQQFGQHDATIEQPGPVLIGDAKCVAKAARDHQHRRFALALEQRIGGDGGSHLHGVDPVDRDPGARRDTQQMTNAGKRGIAILLRVLRQQLVSQQPTIRPACNDVGEGAAAVDPELPTTGNGTAHR